MSLSALALIQLLQQHRLRIFRTSDVMALGRFSPEAASQALRRMALKGAVTALKKGVWMNQLAAGVDPMEAVPCLSAPWPGYVSLYSALSRQGVIEEVPQAIYAVTAGRPARRRTAVGVFHFHHLPERLIWGYRQEPSGTGSFPLAEPEKAYLDLAYLGLIPRSPLGLPYKRDGNWALQKMKLLSYARRFQYPPLLDYVKRIHFRG